MLIEKNNIEIPETLLNAKYYEEVIENGLYQSRININSVSFNMGSGNGDNYCSQIYRIHIKYNQLNETLVRELSIIVKYMPIIDENRFLIDDLGVFQKEKIMYFQVLPQLEILLDNIRFAPRCYDIIKIPIHTFAFEDMKLLNYQMADRENGLNFHHAQLVLQKLGKFHATSMILAQKNPSIMKQFSTGLLNAKALRKSESFRAIFSGNFEALKRTASSLPGFESIAEKLKKIDYIERLEIETEPRTGEICVLNHGDLWVNNILFKYNANKEIIDLIFLDYQMSYFSSPAMDLQYFINTSLDIDVLRTKRDELLKSYYSSLHQTLSEQFCYKNIPSFDDIKNEFRFKEFYGFISFFAVFPLISISKDNSDGMSIESLADENSGNMKRDIVFSSERFLNVMKYSLKRFDSLGIFD